jgi:putative flippase GtrA
MFRKDYVYAGVIGFITAIFLMPILIYSETPLAFGGVTIPLWALFIVLPLGEYAAYVVASQLFSQITALKQLGRFGIVGLMNFSIDTGIVYMLQHYTGIELQDRRMLYLFIISTSTAIVNSYFWQRTWTFSETKAPTAKEFMGFLIVTLLSIVINSSVAFLAAQSLLGLNILAESRVLGASKIIATAVSLFWNFLGYKFFVFGKK